MSLKEELRIKFKNINDLIQKTNEISEKGKKAKEFTGDLIVTVVKDTDEGGDNLMDQNGQFHKEVQEKLDIIDRIRKRGKTLKKESISELYEIGERNEEDWGNENN